MRALWLALGIVLLVGAMTLLADAFAAYFLRVPDATEPATGAPGTN